MDAALQNALSAVSLPDDAAAQRWFQVVCAAFQSLDQRDWDDFTSELGRQAGDTGVDSQIVDQFTQAMSSNDPSPLDTIGQMSAYGDQLLGLYRQVMNPGGQQGAQGSAASSADTDAWNAFLAENGPYWNGDEAAWDQFRTWFVYQAGQQGLTDPASGFIAYVEGQSDKVAAFAAYGVTIARPTAGTADQSTTSAADDASASQPAHTPDASTFPETKPGDSGDWVAYLDAMLTSNGF